MSPRTQALFFQFPSRARPAGHSLLSARLVPWQSTADSLALALHPCMFPLQVAASASTLGKVAPNSYFPGAPSSALWPSSSLCPSWDLLRRQTFERIKIKRSRSRAENPSSPAGLPQPMGVELPLLSQVEGLQGGEVRDARDSLTSWTHRHLHLLSKLGKAHSRPWCSRCRQLPRAAPLPCSSLAWLGRRNPVHFQGRGMSAEPQLQLPPGG